MKTFPVKEKIHQAWGPHRGTETGEKGHEKEQKEVYWGVMWICVSNSDQESFNSSSSEESEVWKLGSGKLFNFNNNHSSKKVKGHT